MSSSRRHQSLFRSGLRRSSAYFSDFILRDAPRSSTRSKRCGASRGFPNRHNYALVVGWPVPLGERGSRCALDTGDPSMAEAALTTSARAEQNRLTLETVLWNLIVGAAYVGFAKLGFTLAFSTQQVTAVWPPTGIAVAALVLLGYRVW